MQIPFAIIPPRFVYFEGW